MVEESNLKRWSTDDYDELTRYVAEPPHDRTIFLDIQASDYAVVRDFERRHRINESNGRHKRRDIWIEILAIRNGIFLRFLDVCTFRCLELAKALHDEGWVLTGVYTYYNTSQHTWQELEPWINQAMVNHSGCTIGMKSLRSHCTCVPVQ